MSSNTNYMITTTFSKQFKKHFHETLLRIFSEREHKSDWRNETEKKIVCHAKQYHEQQLNALTGNTVTNAPAIAV